MKNALRMKCALIEARLSALENEGKIVIIIAGGMSVGLRVGRTAAKI